MDKYENKLLLLLLNCFALSAPANDSLRLLAEIYGALLILFLMTCQVLIFLLKFVHVYPKLTSSMVVVDVLQNAVLVLHNCAAILKANRRNDNVVQNTINKVKTALKTPATHARKYVEVVAAQSTVLILLILLLLTPVHRELKGYKYLVDVFFAFNIWLELLVVMQIFYTNRAIMDNFRELNATIAKFVFQASVLTPDRHAVDKAKQQRICSFLKLHNALTDAMSMTSANFGVQLSFLCVLLILVTIQGISVALKTATGYCPYYAEHLHLITTILGVVVILHVLFIFVVVFSCTHVNDEAKKSSAISSKLLIELQTLQEDLTLKKLLLIFITYCKCSDNFYSVLGFIDIDHETILILLECFSLFIVLVLQYP